MSSIGFDVIPVIDLKRGAVVRARHGMRHLYAPIETKLAATSRPADVVAGLIALYPFDKIYVADLDAIAGDGNHFDCIAALADEFRDACFWVDAGIGRGEDAAAWLATHRCDLVLGSESLADVRPLEQFRRCERILLSLDFRGETPQGPPQIFKDESLWPPRVIVMTLGRVGSQAGPDAERLSATLDMVQGRHDIYAAGGVRGRTDLEALRRSGAAGVLVASALHDGHVSADDLRAAEQFSRQA